MIVFILLCILATLVAGPVGIAAVLGGYAALALFAFIYNVVAEIKHRRWMELHSAAREMGK